MQAEKIKNTEITDVEKENFFKSILADKPYEENMSLFDGQFLVSFKTMTVKENSDIVRQIELDRKAERAADSDVYMITIATYRLAMSTIKIDGTAFSNISSDNHTPSDEFDSYVAARAATVQSWSTSKLSILLDAFQKFESKVIKLTNEVQTVNFWKASA